MTLARDRKAEHYSDYDGAVITPASLSSVETLAQGQIATVNDQPGLPLWTRDSNGSLVEAVQPYGARVLNATKEVLQFYVDTTSGTSPPAGTVIREQSEYDALGYDFKYPDDVLDTLPDLIMHPVIVRFRDGTHSPRPANLGVPNNELLFNLPGRIVSASSAADISVPPFYYATIYWTSENTNELEAAQAGTASGRTITRSSGTWTTNQHAGSFVLITSGPGAGSRYPIESNTTTVLAVPGALSAGSVTFSVVEPGAALVSTASSTRLLAPYTPALVQFPLNVVNLTIGSATYPVRDSYRKNEDRIFEDCKLHFLYQASTLDGGSVQLSYDHCDAVFYEYYSDGLSVWGGELRSIYSCFRTSYTSAGDGIINLKEGSYCSLYRSSLIPDASFGAGAVLRIAGANIWESDQVNIAGNGSCTGFESWGGQVDANFNMFNCALGAHYAYGRTVHYEGFAASESTNTDGILVEKGAVAVVINPSSITASGNEITLDGTTNTYANLTASDYLDGSKGSKIIQV